MLLLNNDEEGKGSILNSRVKHTQKMSKYTNNPY